MNLIRVLVRHLIFTIVLLTYSQQLIANETSLRSYALYNYGNFQLIVPDTWRDKKEQQLAHLPPTITFTPLYDTSFHIQISPMWPFKEGLEMPTHGDIEQLINIAAENAKAQAVEGSISISKLESTTNKGYYYSATDKAPKPGEYKHMTQGMIRIDELFVTFTILTNDNSIGIAESALKMMADGLHIKNNQ